MKKKIYGSRMNVAVNLLELLRNIPLPFRNILYLKITYLKQISFKFIDFKRKLFKKQKKKNLNKVKKKIDEK